MLATLRSGSGPRVAAEPIPETPKRPATGREAAELQAMVTLTFADDSDADRGEALAAALADPGATPICCSAIAAERGIDLAKT